MAKRASALIMLFIAAAVLAVLFIGSLQFKQRQAAVQTEGTEQGYRGQLGSVGELFKNYGYHTLKDSSVKAMYRTGLKNGGRPNWYAFSCANPPSVEDSNLITQAYTTEYFNTYMSTIDDQDMDTSLLNESGKIMEVEVHVTEADIAEPPLGMESTGPVDERFLISGRSGGDSSDSVEVISFDGEQRQSFQHAYTIEVWPDRYWYLFRRMRTWVEEGFVPGATCNAMEITQEVATTACNNCPLPGPLTEGDVNAILEEGTTILEGMFDGQVECEHEIICFYAEVHHPMTEQWCEEGCATTGCSYTVPITQECASWHPPSNQQSECWAQSGSDCTNPYYGTYVGGSCYDEDWEEPQFCYGYGTEQYANYRFKVTCTDMKYQNPILRSGYQNQFLEVVGHIAWEHIIGPPNPCQ